MNDISENDLADIPTNCHACNGNLYGAVHFCPYCGKSVHVTLAPKEEQEGGVILPPEQRTDQPPMELVSAAHVLDEEVISVQPPFEPVAPPLPPLDNKGDPHNGIVTTSGDTVEKRNGGITPLPTTKPWVTTVQENKLVVGLLILLVLGGGSATSYYLLNGLEKMADGVSSSASPNKPPALAGGQRDAARIRSLDTLRAGTDLSVRMTQIPKLEKVLGAAQKLLEVSPRYQDEVNTSTANLESVQKDRDNKLLSYIGLLSELSRYTQDDLSYALHIVGSDELTDREKKVLELLNAHLAGARDGSQADPRRILTDFSQVFDSFVE